MSCSRFEDSNMKSGYNPNRVAAESKNRAEWEATFRDLYERGNNVTDIHRLTGKSRVFVRRVLIECGAMVVEDKPESVPETKTEPVKLTDPGKQVIHVPDGTGPRLMTISLPAFPWGEFDRDPRYETAPRGRTHMYSSPVTRAEQMARELWREAGV